MAECLMSALGSEHRETDEEFERAFVGAVLLAEAIVDLRVLRIAMTKQE